MRPPFQPLSRWQRIVKRFRYWLRSPEAYIMALLLCIFLVLIMGLALITIRGE